MGYHNVVRPAMSCAIREVYGIDMATTGRSFVKDVYEKTNAMNFNHQFRFVMFSHYQTYFPKCEEICKYIEDNNLGTIQRSEREVNPNSYNTVQIYIWTIKNWEMYAVWYQTEIIENKPARVWTKVTTA